MDVVVEYRVLIVVEVQEAFGVAHAKVFEVQKAVRVVFPDELDEPMWVYASVHVRGFNCG